MSRAARIVTLATVLLGALSLGGCGIFGGAQNTRPPAALAPIKTTLRVDHLWTSSIGNGNGGYFLHLRPYVSGKLLYAADHAGTVAAYALKDGRQQWSVKTGHKLVGGVVGGDGMLFVGTQDGMVLGISLKQRGLVWQTQLSSEVMALSGVSEGTIVAHTNDGKLFAIDTTTGNVLWSHGSEPPNLILRGKSRPVIDSGNVIAGFSSGKLAAFSLDTGAQLWELQVGEARGASELQRLVDVDGCIVLSDSGNTVYAASYNGRVVAAQTANGQLEWSHKMSSYAGLALGPNAVFVSDADSDIWALDRSNGASLWKQDALHFREVTAPTVVAGYVVVGDYAGYLQWLSSSDGSLVAREQVGGGAIQVAPVAVGDTIYVQTAGGRLSAYRVLGPSDKANSSNPDGGSSSTKVGGFNF
ncbi:MAG: outer membrane protein assembly factor BamB [Acidihalobacter sp.]